MIIKFTKSEFNSLILIMFGGLISILYFSEIYDEIYGLIIFSIYFIIISTVNFKTQKISRDFAWSLILFLSIIFYYYFNETIDLAFTWYFLDSRFNTNPANIESILSTTIIVFFIFIIGYVYSSQQTNPLNIFSRILFLQIFAFILNVMWKFFYLELTNQYSLEIGSLFIFSIPYLLIAINLKKIKFDQFFFRFDFLLFLLTAFFLFQLSLRGSLLSFMIFVIHYYLYPFFTKRLFFYKLIFFVNIFFIFLLKYLYLKFYDNIFLAELSMKYFNKSFDSGRPSQWMQLIEIIKDKLIFGHGHLLQSNYIQSLEYTWISISSHNLYLELLLTGGLIILFLFLILLYKIWIQMRSVSENYYGRIGSSILIASFYIISTSQMLLSQNIMINFLFWFFIAVSIGQVRKNS